MKKIYDEKIQNILENVDMTKGYIGNAMVDYEQVGVYIPYTETELRIIEIEERLKFLNDWFDDYQLSINQYERELRIQNFSPQSVLQELQKIDESKTLPDLLGFNENIIRLEVTACLYFKEKNSLEEELAGLK